MDKDTPPRPSPASPRRSVVSIAVLVVGSVVALGFCALFPYALYANVVALVDGYRAAHGTAGTPGTVTIVSKSRADSETICYGDFVPAGDGPSVRVRVELPGPCTIGDRHDARLTKPAARLFTGYDTPKAWVSGSQDWATYGLLVVFFGVLNVGPVIMIVGAIVKASRQTDTPQTDTSRGPDIVAR